MLQEIQLKDIDSNFRKLIEKSAIGNEILIKSGNDSIARIIPFQKKKQKRKSTAGALLHSEIVGMWHDREDIGDNIVFARNLREKSQNRELM